LHVAKDRSKPYSSNIDLQVKRSIPETQADQFGPFSGCFFYPLMAGYDRQIRTLDLLGSDSIVLGRLLFALGTILYSAAGSLVSCPAVTCACLPRTSFKFAEYVFPI